MKHRVTFVPKFLTASVCRGATVRDAANWAGLAIESTCGGRGVCGKCKVKVEEAGAESEADRRWLSKTQIQAGWRLACRTVIQSDCRVEVPAELSAPQAAVFGHGQSVAVDPNVRKLHLRLKPPSREDPRSDLTRLSDALREAGYETTTVPAVWRTLPKILREAGFSITAVVCGDELIAIEAGDTGAKNFGLALDIGTTTVAGALIDLNSGRVERVESMLNRQASCGSDVITRISYANSHEGGLAILRERIVETINELVERAIGPRGVARENIYEAIAVGNATMLHLLLGADPAALGVSPFIPVIQNGVAVAAGDLGLRLHPEARLSTLPHLGAYVGADVVAGLLTTDTARGRDGRLRLYLDVGTNSEIVLGCGERNLCTAAPAGPAFEGTEIRCGMRASAGAIEHVQIRENVRLGIIGGGSRPAGICGSGLVDAVAELLNYGLLDSSGRFVAGESLRDRLPAAVIERLIQIDGAPAFLLSSAEEQIAITQRDVRELQAAKAAIAAGIGVLFSRMGRRVEDLEEVLLAGSFGSYLRPASARRIGLVPWVPLDRVKAVGNAAGEGAKMALLSRREREAARQMPNYVEYAELSGDAAFNGAFTGALEFPR